jgi:hypothetical protein
MSSHTRFMSLRTSAFSSDSGVVEMSVMKSGLKDGKAMPHSF